MLRFELDVARRASTPVRQMHSADQRGDRAAGEIGAVHRDPAGELADGLPTTSQAGWAARVRRDATCRRRDRHPSHSDLIDEGKRHAMTGWRRADHPHRSIGPSAANATVPPPCGSEGGSDSYCGRRAFCPPGARRAPQRQRRLTPGRGGRDARTATGSAYWLGPWGADRGGLFAAEHGAGNRAGCAVHRRARARSARFPPRSRAQRAQLVGRESRSASRAL